MAYCTAVHRRRQEYGFAFFAEKVELRLKPAAIKLNPRPIAHQLQAAAAPPVRPLPPSHPDVLPTADLGKFLKESTENTPSFDVLFYYLPAQQMPTARLRP